MADSTDTAPARPRKPAPAASHDVVNDVMRRVTAWVMSAGGWRQVGFALAIACVTGGIAHGGGGGVLFATLGGFALGLFFRAPRRD